MYSSNYPEEEPEDQAFIYPASDNDDDEEEFVYPSAVTDIQPLTLHPPSHATEAQLEALYTAASSGDLLLLKRLFKTALESGSVESFSLANAASSRTGFTALHVAASRGYLDIATWRMFLFRKVSILNLSSC